MVMMHRHVKAIQEAGALDQDKMTAPKEIWFDNDELTLWFEERTRLAQERVNSG